MEKAFDRLNECSAFPVFRGMMRKNLKACAFIFLFRRSEQTIIQLSADNGTVKNKFNKVTIAILSLVRKSIKKIY